MDSNQFGLAPPHAIAQTLGLARETVRSHIKHVLRKLGVGTRAEAVAIARRLRPRRS